jgi:hypothetical protein
MQCVIARGDLGRFVPCPPDTKVGDTTTGTPKEAVLVFVSMVAVTHEKVSEPLKRNSERLNERVD